MGKRALLVSMWVSLVLLTSLSIVHADITTINTTVGTRFSISDSGFDHSRAAEAKGISPMVISSDNADTYWSERPLALFSGNTNSYWPTFKSGSPLLIPICWKNPSTANQPIRDYLRRLIEGQWSRWARINFSGWGDCSTAPTTRHIEITLEPSKGGGQCPWSENPKETDYCWFGTQCVAKDGVNCLGGMPVHEIGHALGFYHEEERLEYYDKTYWGGSVPAGCEKQDFCIGKDAAKHCPSGKYEKLGGYDPQSVMSYCRAKDHETALSPNDIASVQHVYGFRKPNQVVTPTGNCAAANVGEPGAIVFSWDCDEASGQFWRRNDHARIYSMMSDSGKCWGYDGTANGSPIKLKSCTSAPAWMLEKVQVIGYGGKCLDLENGNTANGTKVQTWTCLGNANQRWTVGPYGEIFFGDLKSKKCLTVPYNSMANGTKLVISDCRPDFLGQRFVTSGNSLKLGSAMSNKCLDVPAQSDASFTPNGAVGTAAKPNLIGNGQLLQVYDCLPNQLNQKWFFRGPLKSGGKCLDLHNGTVTNGQALQLYDCLGNENQEWDIYF